jgi:phage-related tail protein
MSDNSDNIVFLFKCIVNFIHDLNELYGEEQKSLQLYNLLMEKTGIVHQEPIKKHIKIFYDFCKENEDAILEKNSKEIKQWKIIYSDKVFIDLESIYNESDEENRQILWQHFITLLAVLIPTSRAKEILSLQKKEKQEQGTETHEEDFLSNIIQKVSSSINVEDNNDPTKMMSNLMSSGIFTELVDDMNNGFNNGDLDLGKMMSSLQGVMGNLSNAIEGMNKNK